MPFPSLPITRPSHLFTPHAPPILSRRMILHPLPPFHAACPSHPCTLHACSHASSHSMPFQTLQSECPSHPFTPHSELPLHTQCPSHPLTWRSTLELQTAQLSGCEVAAEKPDFATVWTESGCLHPLEGDVVEVVPASDKSHPVKRFGNTDVSPRHRCATARHHPKSMWPQTHPSFTTDIWQNALHGRTETTKPTLPTQHRSKYDIRHKTTGKTPAQILQIKGATLARQT
jgi:hypothetical protein